MTALTTVGGTASLEMSIPGDEGLSYLMELSLSNMPTILTGGIAVPLEIDGLTSLTMTRGNPTPPGAVGVLNATGQASLPLTIPPLPSLAGITLYATAMAADAPTVPVLRTVFPTPLPRTSLG